MIVHNTAIRPGGPEADWWAAGKSASDCGETEWNNGELGTAYSASWREVYTYYVRAQKKLSPGPVYGGSDATLVTLKLWFR